VLHRAATSIALNGPVIGGGWWIRMEYASPRGFRAHIGLGDTREQMWLPAGDHTAYFQADGRYDSVDLSYGARGRGTCVTQLTLGAPVPPLTTGAS
jgi:hypothetical protein